MAKLANTTFHYRNQKEEVYRYEAGVTVETDGTFHVTLPDDLEDSARQLLKNDKAPKKYQVYIDRPKLFLRVSGASLESCKTFINDAIKNHMAVTTKRELVIWYIIGSDSCYTVGKDGEIGPNGYIIPDGKHHGNLHATENRPAYAVRVGAALKWKVTHSRGSGDLVEYAYVGRDDVDESTHAGMLRNFNGISIGERDQGRKEMPYSEAAAKFFYDMMLSMCELAHKVNTYFGDDTKLLAAIESKTNLLTYGGSK